VRAETPAPVPNRGLITISIMLANIMQGVDNTILNVALPHIQGSLSVSLDQIAWALTSYIVCAAIMMPLTGWFAGQFGIKYVFLAPVIGFTLASALCGAATSIPELVFFRALQGVAGAGLIPAGAPRARNGDFWYRDNPRANYGAGARRLVTYDYSWRWVFYINLPVGVVCTPGILVFVRRPATCVTNRSISSGS
jgi:DHA2 family multidrug resistance protein